MSYDKTFWGTTRKVPDRAHEDGWDSVMTGVVDDLIDHAEQSSFLSAGGVPVPYLLAASNTLAASATLTRTHPLHKLTGSGGAVTLSAVTAIADGTKDGEVLRLAGAHAVNTVTILNGANTDLLVPSITLGLGDELELRWDATSSNWIQVTAGGASGGFDSHIGFVSGSQVLPYVKYKGSVDTLTGGATFTRTHSFHRLKGSGGAVTLSATTSIADGTTDGEVLTLIGADDSFPVLILDGSNVELGNRAYVNLTETVGIVLVWSATRGSWVAPHLGSPVFTGNIELTNSGQVRFYEPTGAGTQYASLQAPVSLGTTLNFQLPFTIPSRGGLLQSDNGGIWTISNALNVGDGGTLVISTPSGTARLVDLTNNSSGDSIRETVSGAKLTAAGVWTDAPCMAALKRDVTPIDTDWRFLTRIRGLSFQKYRSRYAPEEPLRHGLFLDELCRDFGFDTAGISAGEVAALAVGACKALVEEVARLKDRLLQLEEAFA